MLILDQTIHRDLQLQVREQLDLIIIYLCLEYHYCKICNLVLFTSKWIVVDCQWSSWSAWGSCSRTCGSGQKRATRQIKTPATGGGRNCQGSSSKTEQCNTSSCPASSPSEYHKLDNDWYRLNDYTHNLDNF